MLCWLIRPRDWKFPWFRIHRYLQLDSSQIKHAWKFLNAALFGSRILLESPALVAIASLHLGCVELRDNNGNSSSSSTSSSSISSSGSNGAGSSHSDPTHKTSVRDTSNNSKSSDNSSSSTAALCDTKWWTRFDVSESALRQTCQWIKEASTRIPSVPTYII